MRSPAHTSRTVAAWLLLCVAYFAIAGSVHIHPIGLPGEPRLEIRPQGRAIAVDPCVACLLARLVVEPGWAPVTVGSALPSSSAIPACSGHAEHDSFQAPPRGRAPPRLLAAAA